MKHIFLIWCVCLWSNVAVWGQKTELPKPTASQLAWQNAEMGVVFHYDLHVFDGKVYGQGYNRINPIEDYNIFNPTHLNTDQWIEAAKAAGAKFAILTATHETGFALWQSDVNPYCLKAVKWQDGKGDVVRDFVNSCRKYGIKPGIYIDENTMRMCKSYRQFVFNKLAEALLKEGKNEKALQVLDKCMEVLPPENVPLDYTGLSTGECYYVLGQKEKAEQIFTAIADNAMRNINWFFRLNAVQLASVTAELEHNLAVMNQVLIVNKHYNPEFNKKYQEEFDNYRMAYSSVRKE